MTKNNDPNPEDRRLQYRLSYPAEQRPKLSVGDDVMEVIDISEWGIRVAANGRDAIAPGDQLSGTLTFRHGASREIVGVVLRISGKDVAAKLEQGVEFRIIFEEHNALQQEELGPST
ncbi:MAG: PilZ domain-containing protein [Reyranella sp.]|nr:PilZ domain-containing protein [Reyranella sp.]